MRGYTQLTREQRYQIYAILNTEQTQTQIAGVPGGYPVTISREFLLGPLLNLASSIR